MSKPIYVVDMFPPNDKGYFTWRNICTCAALNKTPLPYDFTKPIQGIIGEHIDAEIGAYIEEREWVFAGGRKGYGWGIKFKTRKGLSLPFAATSPAAALTFLSVLGAEPEYWVGKKVRLQVATAQKFGAKDGVKTMCVRAKLIPEEAK